MINDKNEKVDINILIDVIADTILEIEKEKENKELLTEKGWNFNIFYPLWFGEEYLDKKRKENKKK